MEEASRQSRIRRTVARTHNLYAAFSWAGTRNSQAHSGSRAPGFSSALGWQARSRARILCVKRCIMSAKANMVPVPPAGQMEELVRDLKVWPN